MATEAQMVANRSNALKSTGPRTPQGKARSAQNALKWGLFSKQVVFTEQEASECTQLSLRIRSLLEPVGELEELLVDEVTANWFRLARCLKIDTGMRIHFSWPKFIASLTDARVNRDAFWSQRRLLGSFMALQYNRVGVDNRTR